MIEGTIDCQEARSRITGYLSGTESSEAVIELEAHFDECIDCRMAFEHRRESQAALKERERSAIDFERISQEAESLQTRSIASALRKQSLQQMLRDPVVEQIEEPSPRVEPMVALTETAESSQFGAEAPSIPKIRRQWKPVAYTCALVSVLAAAILVSANSGTIFETPQNQREPGSIAVNPNKAANSTAKLTSDPAPIVPPQAEALPSALTDGVLAGETVGSDTGLTLSTAKPVQVQSVQPVRRYLGRKKNNRRKPVRRSTVRRSSAPRQGVRVYNP
jgi:hypothetical protein